MKVGLVRHFKVDYQYPSNFKLITGTEFKQCLHEYTMSNIKNCIVSPNLIKWDKCYSSDLFRAVKTAQKLFNGQIIKTQNLRELDIFPTTNRNIKLPFLLWLILGRIAWMLSHKSQLESKQIFKERINRILEEIIFKEDNDILIVSHGFLMMFLRKELLSQGFKGPHFISADNGKIYVFEK